MPPNPVPPNQAALKFLQPNLARQTRANQLQNPARVPKLRLPNQPSRATQNQPTARQIFKRSTFQKFRRLTKHPKNQPSIKPSTSQQLPKNQQSRIPKNLKPRFPRPQSSALLKLRKQQTQTPSNLERQPLTFQPQNRMLFNPTKQQNQFRPLSNQPASQSRGLRISAITALLLAVTKPNLEPKPLPLKFALRVSLPERCSHKVFTW